MHKRTHHEEGSGDGREELESALIDQLDSLRHLLDEAATAHSTAPPLSPTSDLTPNSEASGKESAAPPSPLEALVEQLVDAALDRELPRLRQELRATLLRQVVARLRRGKE